MKHIVIIGSGPSAAGVALAYAKDPAYAITVIDIGATLEPDHAAARDRIAGTPEVLWSPADRELVQHQPVAVRGAKLPQKRTYGSDFPFRDVGQQAGLPAAKGEVAPVVSGAFGGFSNVWGAQTMPFSRATFNEWPVSFDDMAPHYRVAMAEMSVSGQSDALETLFPHLVPPNPLPEVSARTASVLERFTKHQSKVESLGVTVGHARLALKSSSCTRCGLCMTGCPEQLIYSSSQTFDRLFATASVTYRSGLLAVKVDEDDRGPFVVVKDQRTGSVETIRADRIFVGCGGIGTTRLVLGSLPGSTHRVELLESVQFLLPAISRRAVGNLRTDRDFTLNQFNMVYDDTGTGLDLVQVHFYPNNPAMERAFPAIAQHRSMTGLRTAALRRLSVGLGYLPSWASPTITLEARSTTSMALPDITINRSDSKIPPPMLRRFLGAMTKAAPALDLWPVLPMVSVSAAMKSYHFGGTFPHARHCSGYQSDLLGRLEGWDNIHLVDGSVLPSVPATTFTLTVMANAHRIATGARKLDAQAQP